MLKEDAATLSGSDRYEGFCVDLLDALATEAAFDYELLIVEDGMYGSYDQNTGEWSGMIGELVHQV